MDFASFAAFVRPLRAKRQEAERKALARFRATWRGGANSPEFQALEAQLREIDRAYWTRVGPALLEAHAERPDWLPELRAFLRAKLEEE